MIRKNEKGALLVEVIAVLGLIALITPILFGQIQRRNEDIVDAQHASELRAVKDAFSAYLLANEEAFALECGLCTPTGEEAGEDVRCLEYISVADEQCETEANVGQELDDKKYLPADFPVGDYTFKLYGKTIAAPNNKYRPVVYGIAYRNTPEPKFGRASKIAAMVGIEGGVVQEAGTIKGMQGVWSKDVTNIQKNTVAVTTSFDAISNSAILKDASFTNMKADNSIQAGEIVASNKVAAKDLLTVASDENCIVSFLNDDVTVRRKGEGSDDGHRCAPVFEVDANTKEVHVAGAFRVRTGQTVGENNCDRVTVEEDCNREAYCVWEKKPTEADPNAGVCINEYVLDPQNISVMEDIKIASRGGMKLSELLPNWSLKNVRSSNATGTISFSGNACPKGSKYGIVLVPTVIQGGGSTFQVGYTLDSNSPKVNASKTEYTGEADSSYTVNVNSTEPYLIHEYCIFD